MDAGLTKQITDLYISTVQQTALGLRVSVEGVMPSTADDVSHAEITEYTLRMIEAVQTATAAIAAHVEALEDRFHDGSH